MAMNASTLSTALFNRLKGLWRGGSPANKVRDPDYFLKELCNAIAEEMVEHIQTNAKCSGLDSGSDSHDNVGIT